MKRLMLGAIMLLVVSFSPMAMAGNNALELLGDANSFFQVPDHDTLDENLADHFTVEAWVKPYDSTEERMILNKEDVYELAVVNGTFQVAFRPKDASWAWIDSTQEVPENKWTHVAMTFDGTYVKLFVGGESAVESDLYPGVAYNSQDTLKIGRRTRGVAGVHSIFNGQIDEVRVSRVIRYTKNFAIPTSAFEPDASTVALYHFDEATGAIVRDASPAGNHGTLEKDARLVPANTPFK